MTESERKLAALLQSTVPEPPESLAPSMIAERARADAEAAPRPPLRSIAWRGLPPLLTAAAVVIVVATIATVSFVTRSSGPALHHPTTPAPTTSGHAPTSPLRSLNMTTPNAPAGQPRGTRGGTHQGGGVPGGTGHPTPPSSPVAHPSTPTGPSTSTPAPPPTCPTSQLSGQAGSPTTDPQSNTTTVVIELDNAGAPCQLSGFPHANLADSSGQQLGGTATPDGSPPPDPVQLVAGGAAYFRLVAHNATTPCSAPQSASVVVTLPDGSLTVPYQVAFCPDTDGSGLTVSAIYPTATIP